MTRITNVVAKFLGKDKWELVEPMKYHVGSADSEEIIVVPAGFITDGASVPRVFWSLIPKVGTYLGAAVIHDYLYYTVGMSGQYTRKDCDKIFLEAMQVLGVKWMRRHLMYRAVRLGGWKGWNRRAKQPRG